MRTPAREATEAEAADLPAGQEERFAGYGVMGLPFASGHVLAMRRFPASSIGPAYTSVWHRDPGGGWTFYQDRPDDQSCARYFSKALDGSKQANIDLTWPSEWALRIVIPELDLEWNATLAATPVTRSLNLVSRAMPGGMWRSPAVLRAMGPVAGCALGAAKVGLVGKVPNGQQFVANPLTIWVIPESNARLADCDFGAPGPLAKQARLGDFWIPQRGIFAVGRAFFEPVVPPP